LAEGDGNLRGRLWTRLSIGVIVLTAAAVLARPAAASWMITPPPYRPKDFALIKKDGVYHLFYIRRNTALSTPQTENDLGHATSLDLYAWTQQPPVLPVRPGSWDNEHVWSPTIVEQGGVYTMLYCGVTNTPGVYNTYQRIGLATSTDLYNWTRLDQPVFSCDQVPWAFCDPLNADLTGFRDPFVMPDPVQPGGWLMAYTANPAADSVDMVVGLASSSGDLSSWTNVKPLWISSRPTTGSGFAESPHLFEHDGLWFLFFTVNGPQAIAYATSADPRADLVDWTWQGSLNAMLGLGSNNWYASEHVQDGKLEYFCYVNGDRIEINLLYWTAPDRFTLLAPPLFHVVSLAWGTSSVQEGQPAQLQIAAVNGTGVIANLEAQVLDGTGQWVPVPPDSVGLPQSVSLTADTTVCSFTPRRWPSGSTGPAQVMVRTTDQTAASTTPLQVTPVPPPPPWPPASSGGDGPDDRVILHIVRFASGGGLSLRVDLAEATTARLELYDLEGRRVAVLVNGPLSSGRHVFGWNGRDRDGRPAGAGVYLARLVTPGAVRITKAALLR
jgi:beta-fructofuranosidase